MKKIKENGFGDTEKILGLVFVGVAFIVTLVMYFINIYGI